jgi:hypothetical protein
MQGIDETDISDGFLCFSVCFHPHLWHRKNTDLGIASPLYNYHYTVLPTNTVEHNLPVTVEQSTSLPKCHFSSCIMQCKKRQLRVVSQSLTILIRH